MRIEWLGHASFLIEGARVRVVTDPYEGVGLAFPKVEADAVTVSHEHFDHHATDLVGGDFEVVRGPGAKTVAGVEFVGVATKHDDAGGSLRGDNTVFCFSVDGVRLVHCGDLGHTLDAETTAAIGPCDVLMVPVGGVYTVDAAGAAAVVEALKPKVVLPMHYKIPGLSLEIADEKPFLAMFSEVERRGSLELTAGALPGTLKVVVLERRA